MSKETVQPKATPEVKPEETKVETPAVEPKVEEKVIVDAPESKLRVSADEPKLSNAEKIVKFLTEKKRGDEYILLNDFLKSLYPVPKLGMKPLWLERTESKQLRVLLNNLVQEKQIEVEANRHIELGLHYYDSQDKNQVTQYHNLVTVHIKARVCS